MKYIIGIDGGGTKSIGYITDETGKLLGKSEEGSLNIHSQGEVEVKSNLHSIINSLIDIVDCKIEDLELISMGIAGVGRVKDRERFLSIIDELGIKVNFLLTTDIHIALLGAHGKEEGILILSGTGSMAIGIDNMGKEYRLGGWGHIIGDEGSGYDIGKKGLSLVAKTIDGLKDSDSLVEMVYDMYGVENTDDFVRYIYSNTRTKADIARISKAVYQCAVKGDQNCLDMINSASQDLVDLAIGLINKIDNIDDLNISIAGGVFENMDLVNGYFASGLYDHYPDMRIVRPMYSPTIGALILGFNNLNKSIDYTVWKDQ